MATLVFTAIGNLVGGPVGGAIGAFAGRLIDSSVIGGGHRDGPRLRELAVTTSSYGQPVPRHFGTLRTAGTIIWATDLVEHSDSSGGKGRPSATTYAYSCSFAVALSSRPIAGIGRIWADGNLLRGAAGDLKVGGAIRIHPGHGDQPRDPLLESALGAQAPGHRGMAYAVFEDLALADYGNRIPALTFELFADGDAISLGDLVEPLGSAMADAAPLPALIGFSDEGGPLRDSLDTLGLLYPFACRDSDGRLAIGPDPAAPAITLPPPAQSAEEGDFGAMTGVKQERGPQRSERIDAIRYYDAARDYLPGVQRIAPVSAGGRSIEFPGVFAADDARLLAARAARRQATRRVTLNWRLAELDPALTPGVLVTAPGHPGIWRIESWEWRASGVELALARQPASVACGPVASDSGLALAPVDRLPSPTALLAFEVPGDELVDPAWACLFAAVSSESGSGGGAALYLDRGGALVPIGASNRRCATIGMLAAPLPASRATLFEPDGQLDVELLSGDDAFSPTDMRGLAFGANRLLVGGEVLQFLHAGKTGPRTWRLTGLLRGRGGTEPVAALGHAAGADTVVLDDALTVLDPAVVPGSAGTVIAAIGRGDPEPVTAPLLYAGSSRTPPGPVHPRAVVDDGGATLGWTRRARGQWLWRDGVEIPLVEQAERYIVGIGPVGAPEIAWEVDTPGLALARPAFTELAARFAGRTLWVSQIGTYARSAPLDLLTL